MNFKEKAARFYYKPTGITGVVEDWVEGREGGDVDPDVKELAVLLEEVYEQGQRATRKQLATLPPSAV